jgi:hypothetical protein
MGGGEGGGGEGASAIREVTAGVTICSRVLPVEVTELVTTVVMLDSSAAAWVWSLVMMVATICTDAAETLRRTSIGRTWA